VPLQTNPIPRRCSTTVLLEDAGSRPRWGRFSEVDGGGVVGGVGEVAPPPRIMQELQCRPADGVTRRRRDPTLQVRSRGQRESAVSAGIFGARRRRSVEPEGAGTQRRRGPTLQARSQDEENLPGSSGTETKERRDEGSGDTETKGPDGAEQELSGLNCTGLAVGVGVGVGSPLQSYKGETREREKRCGGRRCVCRWRRHS